MFIHIRSFLFFLSFSLGPILARAQGVGRDASTPQNLSDVAVRILDIFGLVVPLIFGIALILFLWGVAQFIGNADNEQKRKEGKNLMIWGIVAFFVMLSVWGLTNILLGTFGLSPVIPFFRPPAG